MKIYSACLFAFVFIVANVFLSLRCINCPHNKRLVNSLDSSQKEIYRRIRSERMRLYLLGTGLGLLFGLVILKFGEDYMGCEKTLGCFVLSTILFVQYSFYTLMPKSTYLVKHLKSEEQIQNWLDVYRYMQKSMAYGQLLGIGIYLGIGLIRS